MAMAGVVKFFNAERGYGFIKPDDGGRDVFVHITAVERAGLKALNEGQRISFDVEPDKKGNRPEGRQSRHHWVMPASAAPLTVVLLSPSPICDHIGSAPIAAVAGAIIDLRNFPW